MGFPISKGVFHWTNTFGFSAEHQLFWQIFHSCW